MHLVFLELTQEIVYLLGLWHEIWRSYQTLPPERGWLSEMRKQILDIQDSSDIVRIILIDWNTTIVIFYDTFKYLRISTLNIQIHHILSARHHLLGSLVAKSDDSLQHTLLILDVILVGQLQGLFQVIDTQHMIFLLDHLFGKYPTLQEYIFQRPEEFSDKQNAIDNTTTEAQRILATIHLRHNLAKKQEQESKENRDNQELQPICLVTKMNNACKNIVQQHDDGDVDEIIGNQNRCQRTFRVFTQHLNFSVGIRLLILQFIYICR